MDRFGRVLMWTAVFVAGIVVGYALTVTLYETMCG